MPCFCPSQVQNLSNLAPKTDLSVQAVPPQMGQLASLLGITNGETLSPSRPDLAMHSVLPSMSSQVWMQSTVGTAVPGIPCLMPNGGPALLSWTARLVGISSSFPFLNPRALIADLKRTLASMAMQLLPFNEAARALPRMHLGNLTLAARLTLSMRSLGLCPMVLSGATLPGMPTPSLSNPRSTFNAAVQSANTIHMPSVPAFALSTPKLNLAMSLASFAPLANMPSSLGLPPVGHSSFNAMAMGLLSSLANQVRMPALPFSIPNMFADLTRLADLSSIHQAFGPNALTALGLAAIRHMLNFISRLRLPAMPFAALSLTAQLNMLPSMDAVRTGAQVVQSGAPSFATSMRFSPALPAILPLLEAINAFKTVLADAFGTLPTSGCTTCKSPL